MRKSLILLLLLGLVALTGCFPPRRASIDYIKDERTKLCFAYEGGSGVADFDSMISVPCSPEVEKAALDDLQKKYDTEAD